MVLLHSRNYCLQALQVMCNPQLVNASRLDTSEGRHARGTCIDSAVLSMCLVGERQQNRAAVQKEPISLAGDSVFGHCCLGNIVILLVTLPNLAKFVALHRPMSAGALKAVKFWTVHAVNPLISASDYTS